MIPAICVIGSKSNSGKTTLIEKLIRELKSRGFKVATIKHDGHNFDIDHPGKDTWRHRQAGADVVMISSSSQLAMIKQLDNEVPLDDLIAMIEGVDIIIVEGYKKGDKPKIEVFRSEVHESLFCKPEELLAIASDVKFDIGVPSFDINDAGGIVDFLEEKFLVSTRF